MNTKPLSFGQPMLHRDIPDGPWIVIADNYLIQKGKDYLIICDLFSKYPFIYKVSTKSFQSPSQPLQELISQYRLPCLLYINNGPQITSSEQFFTPIHQVNAQPWDSHTMLAMVPTITHPFENSVIKHSDHPMVLEATEEENH